MTIKISPTLCLVLIMPFLFSDKVLADSEKKMKTQKVLYGTVGTVFAIGAVVDGCRCAKTCGTTARGALLMKSLGPCMEAVVAAALSGVSFYMMSQVEKDRDEQLGKSKVLGEITAPPKSCTTDELRNCAKLKKFVKVKKKNCSCQPANPIVNSSGDITDPDLAAAVPDDFADSIKEAVQNNDLSQLENIANEVSDGEFGDFAATEGGVAGALDAAIGNSEGLESFEGGEEEEEEEGREELGFVGGGNSGLGKGGLISGNTKLTPASNRFGKKIDKKKKNKKKKKVSGIINNPKRPLFAAVTRKLNDHKSKELQGNLIQKKGKFSEIKYIPDASTVKDAVQNTKIGKKKSSLSEDIQKYNAP
jgi:hypothetical protein